MPPGDGAPENRRLVILDPPGDVIGLSHGGRVTLRVAYHSELGEALPGAEVRFAMIATAAGESTAGSTLSASASITGADGIAQVDLAVGADNTAFRVSADAADAPTVRFTVFVSDQGFATVTFTPRHAGFRPVEAFERVEARLLLAETATCAEIDIDALPESTFPPRSADAFDAALVYQSLAADGAYTLIAWAQAPGSATPLAAGCVDLSAANVRPGRMRLDLPVRDREPTLAGGAALAVWWDLRPVVTAVAARGADRAWRRLSCPAGPGQLLLSCAVDAAAPDGALDCDATGTGPLATAIEARRGPPGADGCRPETLPGGGPSLDRQIADAVAAGGSFPVGPALDDLVAARAGVASSFFLRSVLSPASGAAARHRLVTAELAAGADVTAIDLGATSRPVLEQAQVGAVIAAGAIALAPHGFTLRYGDLARVAFLRLGLVPAGLDADAGALGRALARSVLAPGGQTGCAGVSAIACGAIGQPAMCLEVACTAGAGALDGALEAWHQAITGSGIDFSLSGTAGLLDVDHDLGADAVGIDDQGAPAGTFDATMTLADGAQVPLAGVPVP